jgi:hypothetical protein
MADAGYERDGPRVSRGQEMDNRIYRATLSHERRLWDFIGTKPTPRGRIYQLASSILGTPENMIRPDVPFSEYAADSLDLEFVVRRTRRIQR